MVLSSIQFVALGKWNSAIFTPDWILKHFDLNATTNLSVESVRMSYDINEMLPTITIRNITFVIKFDRLIITCLKIESLSELDKISKSILVRLNETPINAFGVNFNYKLDKNIKIFEDPNAKASNGYSKNVIQENKKFGQFEANKIYKLNEQECLLTFNFHFTNKENFMGCNFNELYEIAQKEI